MWIIKDSGQEPSEAQLQGRRAGWDPSRRARSCPYGPECGQARYEWMDGFCEGRGDLFLAREVMRTAMEGGCDLDPAACAAPGAETP